LRLEKTAKVVPTAGTMDEVLRAFAPSLEILRRAKKLGVLLLQLSPAFSPRKHELNELENVLQLTSAFRVAVELRNRNWVEGERREKTLDFFRERNAIFVNVDAPSEKHFTIMPSELNAITNSVVAYLRMHGRDSRAYITGTTVAGRFHYNYSDADMSEEVKRG